MEIVTLRKRNIMLLCIDDSYFLVSMLNKIGLPSTEVVLLIVLVYTMINTHLNKGAVVFLCAIHTSNLHECKSMRIVFV